MAETKINQNQIESSKFGVLNVIQAGSSAGTLERNGAIISKFSRSAYLSLGAMLDKQILSLTSNTYIKNFGNRIKSADSFECVFLCNYKTKTATKQFLFGEQLGWASRIGIESGNVTMQLNFTGGGTSSSLIIENGSYSFVEDEDYYWKFAYDGSKYTLSIKGKNENNYTTVVTMTNNTKFSSGREWIIGIVDTADTNNEWGSYIDLSECYIKINDEIWWKGVETL